MASHPERTGLLTIDIEATGSGPNDKMFAIGFADIPMIVEIVEGNDEFEKPEDLTWEESLSLDRFKGLIDTLKKLKEESWEQFLKRECLDPDGRGFAFRKHLKKRLVVLDLQKPKKMSWESFWVTQGFDMQTWEEFWCHHVDILDFLQGQDWTDKCQNEEEFSGVVNDVFGLVEERYKSVILLTDTVTTDVPVTSALLSKHGHLPLNKTRKGGYQSGIEVDSYTLGILRLPITTDWRDVKEMKERYIAHYLPLPRVYDHNPENDAAAILGDLVATHIYNHQQLLDDMTESAPLGSTVYKVHRVESSPAQPLRGEYYNPARRQKLGMSTGAVVGTQRFIPSDDEGTPVDEF